jgi:phosphinothricin acetyltransferase
MSSLNTHATARRARPDDAPAIAHIYNQGIEDRVANFQTVPRTNADIEHMLADREGRYPSVVVERDGNVVAWASAGTYHSTPWYQPIAEHSVYVDRGHRGTGVGRIALQALRDEAEQLGFLKLVSRIFPENVASRALHRKVGFRDVGITGATASWTANGAIASSSRSCWTKPRRTPKPVLVATELGPARGLRSLAIASARGSPPRSWRKGPARP